MTTHINYTGKRCKTAYKRRLPSFMYLYFEEQQLWNQAGFGAKTSGFGSLFRLFFSCNQAKFYCMKTIKAVLFHN